MGHKAAAASRRFRAFQAVAPAAAALLARLFASGFMRFSQFCAHVLDPSAESVRVGEGSRFALDDDLELATF